MARPAAKPIPLDPSRGHRLHMAEYKIVDGGVVAWRYRAFCRCYWSQRYATENRAVALAAYNRHKR